MVSNHSFNEVDLIPISAKHNTGIDLLKEKLFATTVAADPTSENTIVTNTRHYTALQQVERSLATIKEGLDNNIPGDLLALDIRYCLQYISEITGDVSNENVLDYIFSKFCIGK